MADMTDAEVDAIIQKQNDAYHRAVIVGNKRVRLEQAERVGRE